uniref:Putative secreted protein n=1 Tax=Anopheles darlingi TaxID=43151 RepID=A0A2M4D5X8_ANODA
MIIVRSAIGVVLAAVMTGTGVHGVRIVPIADHIAPTENVDTIVEIVAVQRIALVVDRRIGHDVIGPNLLRKELLGHAVRRHLREFLRRRAVPPTVGSRKVVKRRVPVRWPLRL